MTRAAARVLRVLGLAAATMAAVVASAAASDAIVALTSLTPDVAEQAMHLKPTRTAAGAGTIQTADPGDLARPPLKASTPAPPATHVSTGAVPGAGISPPRNLRIVPAIQPAE